MEVTYLGKLVLGDQNTEQDWDPERPLETCNTRDIVTKRTTANSRAASAAKYRRAIGAMSKAEMSRDEPYNSEKLTQGARAERSHVMHAPDVVCAWESS